MWGQNPSHTWVGIWAGEGWVTLSSSACWSANMSSTVLSFELLQGHVYTEMKVLYSHLSVEQVSFTRSGTSTHTAHTVCNHLSRPPIRPRPYTCMYRSHIKEERCIYLMQEVCLFVWAFSHIACSSYNLLSWWDLFREMRTWQIMLGCGAK